MSGEEEHTSLSWQFLPVKLVLHSQRYDPWVFLQTPLDPQRADGEGRGEGEGEGGREGGREGE